LVRSKGKTSLPNGSIIGDINDVVVIDDSASCLFILGLIGEADEDETVLSDLPRVRDHSLDFVEIRLGGDRLVELVDSKLSLPFLDVVGLELKRVVVLWLAPHDHRIVVGFSRHVFVGPLRLFGLIYCHCSCCLLLIQLQRILKVS